MDSIETSVSDFSTKKKREKTYFNEENLIIIINL